VQRLLAWLVTVKRHDVCLHLAHSVLRAQSGFVFRLLHIGCNFSVERAWALRIKEVTTRRLLIIASQNEVVILVKNIWL